MFDTIEFIKRFEYSQSDHHEFNGKTVVVISNDKIEQFNKWYDEQKLNKERQSRALSEEDLTPELRRQMDDGVNYEIDREED